MITLKKWTGFFGRNTSDLYHKIKVRAPRDYFKRADIFIEDILYTSHEELYGINKTFLIKLLFDNFLEHVRLGKDLYDYLLHLRQTYGHIYEACVKAAYMNNQPLISAVPKFQWSLSSRRDKREEAEYLTLNIGLHPREINRMEVFFADLEWKYEERLNMELDELVSLLFIEFITELRNGLNDEMKEDIIDTILMKWKER